jgi:hypothetical protein
VYGQIAERLVFLLCTRCGVTVWDTVRAPGGLLAGEKRYIRIYYEVRILERLSKRFVSLVNAVIWSGGSFARRFGLQDSFVDKDLGHFLLFITDTIEGSVLFRTATGHLGAVWPTIIQYDMIRLSLFWVTPVG